METLCMLESREDMEAANTPAMTSPEIPTGSWRAMKRGKTWSFCMPKVNSSGWLRKKTNRHVPSRKKRKAKGKQSAPLSQMPLAAAVAGTVVATFYSAMRVVLVGALAGATTSLVCLTVASSPLTPWQVMALCGSVGLALGIPASAFLERRRGALVVAGAGLTTGAIAGLGGTLLELLHLPRLYRI